MTRNVVEPENTVEEAKQVVRCLFDTEISLIAKLRSKRVGVSDREAALGDAMLDGNGDNAMNLLAQVRLEAESLQRGIMAARKRRVDAIRAAYKVEAEGLRTEAAAKRANAAQIRTDCEPHLRALSKLENVQFDHSVLFAQRTPGWQVDPRIGKPLSECAPLEAMRDPIGGGAWSTPLSGRLLPEASTLDGKAAELEGREVRQSGSVTKLVREGSLVAALLEAPEFADPFQIAPSTAEVEAWADDIERQIEARRIPPPQEVEYSGASFGNRLRRWTGERRVTVGWASGVIDPRRSEVVIQPLNPSSEPITLRAARSGQAAA